MGPDGPDNHGGGGAEVSAARRCSSRILVVGGTGIGLALAAWALHARGMWSSAPESPTTAPASSAPLKPARPPTLLNTKDRPWLPRTGLAALQRPPGGIAPPPAAERLYGYQRTQQNRKLEVALFHAPSQETTPDLAEAYLKAAKAASYTPVANPTGPGQFLQRDGAALLIRPVEGPGAGRVLVWWRAPS